MAENDGNWMLSIRIGGRPDGGLRVWSEDIPGLILSGIDPDKVMASIWPALHALPAAKAVITGVYEDQPPASGRTKTTLKELVATIKKD
jgi:hypothetical protein